MHRKGPDGEDEELYVCKQCLDGDKSQKVRPGNVKPTIITADGSEPPAFVKNFLDAAVGLIEGVADGKMGKARRRGVCRGRPGLLDNVRHRAEGGVPLRLRRPNAQGQDAGKER